MATSNVSIAPGQNIELLIVDANLVARTVMANTIAQFVTRTQTS